MSTAAQAGEATQAGAATQAARVAQPRWGRDGVVVAQAVLPHPGLWWSSLGALRRMARRGWWHRAPFLPVPGETYWRFRLVTAYGGDGSGGELTPSDVVAFLRWCQGSRPRRG